MEDKIKRRYDLIVDIFGADHADTYPDVILALKSLGFDTNHIKVLLYQFVTLYGNDHELILQRIFRLTFFLLTARKVIYYE